MSASARTQTTFAGNRGAGAAEAVVHASARLHGKLFYRIQRFGLETLAIAFGIVLAIWSLLPIYNMWMIALDSHDDVFSGSIWPDHPTLESFRVVVTEDFLVSRALLAPVRQQLLRRPVGDVPDAGDRLAGQLHDRPDADQARLDAQQRGADDVRHSGIVPGDPDVPDHADLWHVQQSVVGDPGADDLRHAICDLHLLAVRQIDPDGTRRVGAYRRRQPVPDLLSGSTCR